MRALPSDPFKKHSVSLLMELIIRPRPVFTFIECPVTRPSKFYKLHLTIGLGTGVFGYGKCCFSSNSCQLIYILLE